MLTVIVVYSVINFIIQSIIQPKYVADAVDLSLTLTFLSLIFWSFVIGPLGAVLALPLTLLTKALLLDVDPNTQWMSTLITSGPAPTRRTRRRRTRPRLVGRCGRRGHDPAAPRPRRPPRWPATGGTLLQQIRPRVQRIHLRDATIPAELTAQNAEDRPGQACAASSL